MNRHNVKFMHPVHAVFPFAELSEESVSMERFLDLLDGLDPDDRYVLIDVVAVSVGLKQCKPPRELDRKLRRCRLFRKACLNLQIDESLALRGLIQQILNRQFGTAWPDFLLQLSQHTLSEQSTVLGCDRSALQRSKKEVWNTRGASSHGRIEAFRLYNLFCERVVGPLIGYC